MGGGVGDGLQVLINASDVGTHERDGKVVQLFEVLEKDGSRGRVGLREDHVRVRVDDLLHLGAVRGLVRGHGNVGHDLVTHLLPCCRDRGDESLSRYV